MTQTLHHNIDGLQILTDSGWESFDGVLFKGNRNTITIRTNNYKITCTPDHKIYTEVNKNRPASSFKLGDKILTVDGKYQRVVEVRLSSNEKVYDILNSGKNNRFYANNLLVSNCEFIIAEETLINPSTLIELDGIDPIDKMGQVRWYEKPKKNEIYTISLDPSLGTGGDYAAIEIFCASEQVQIGEWKHNKTDIPNQIKLIAQICNYIYEVTGQENNIYYSCENNSIGEAALLSFKEYGEHNIKGIFISEPGGKRKGFTTTQRPKLASCAKFKSLLESKKLKIKSKSLISELKTYIASGGSYAAKIGENDDLVSACLIQIRMMQHLSSFNLDMDMKFRDHNEVIQPLPFFAILS